MHFKAPPLLTCFKVSYFNFHFPFCKTILLVVTSLALHRLISSPEESHRYILSASQKKEARHHYYIFFPRLSVPKPFFFFCSSLLQALQTDGVLGRAGSHHRGGRRRRGLGGHVPQLRSGTISHTHVLPVCLNTCFWVACYMSGLIGPILILYGRRSRSQGHCDLAPFPRLRSQNPRSALRGISSDIFARSSRIHSKQNFRQNDGDDAIAFCIQKGKGRLHYDIIIRCLAFERSLL